MQRYPGGSGEDPTIVQATYSLTMKPFALGCDEFVRCEYGKSIRGEGLVGGGWVKADTRRQRGGILE